MNRKCRPNTARVPPIAVVGPLSRLEIVGRLSASLLILALTAALAGGLSACGSSSNLLPGTTASEINSNLDEVRQLVSEDDCAGATEAASSVTTQVEELGGVDTELKEALSEGAARLNEVVAGCAEASEDEASEALEAEAEEEELDLQEAEEEKVKKPKKEPAETAEPPTKETPAEPKGEAKGQEEGKGPSEEAPSETESEAPSGGVGPGAPVGEG